MNINLLFNYLLKILVSNPESEQIILQFDKFEEKTTKITMY